MSINYVKSSVDIVLRYDLIVKDQNSQVFTLYPYSIANDVREFYQKKRPPECSMRALEVKEGVPPLNTEHLEDLQYDFSV